MKLEICQLKSTPPIGPVSTLKLWHLETDPQLVNDWGKTTSGHRKEASASSINGNNIVEYMVDAVRTEPPIFVPSDRTLVIRVDREARPIFAIADHSDPSQVQIPVYYVQAAYIAALEVWKVIAPLPSWIAQQVPDRGRTDTVSTNLYLMFIMLALRSWQIEHINFNTNDGLNKKNLEFYLTSRDFVNGFEWNPNASNNYRNPLIAKTTLKPHRILAASQNSGLNNPDVSKYELGGPVLGLSESLLEALLQNRVLYADQIRLIREAILRGRMSRRGKKGLPNNPEIELALGSD